MSSLYFWLDIGAIAFPLALSFNKIGHFYKRWKAVFSAISITGLFFISWDILFTIKGVWGFNPDYLLGIDILHLPLEEWLFFVCVPYSCLFLYDQFLILKVKDVLKPIEKYLDFFIMGIAGAFFIKGFGNTYTTTISSLVLLFIVVVQLTKPQNKGIFYLCYFIILIPFALINGILTGAKTSEPVVWYNNTENLGVRLITIPVEDFLYYFLIFGMCWVLFERFKNKD
jgi:lycopene cyclase domain-containing protein